MRGVLTESDDSATGCVDVTLCYQYNSGRRYVKWNQEEGSLLDTESLARAVQAVRRTVSRKAMEDLTTSEIFSQARHIFRDFSSSLGLNCIFWTSYHDMMRLVLQFIRSVREADWQLHL